MAGVDFRGLRPGKLWPRRSRLGGAGVHDATDCAGVGFGAIRREVFCPWRPLEVIKPWQARTFAATELASSMTLKS